MNEIETGKTAATARYVCTQYKSLDDGFVVNLENILISLAEGRLYIRERQ
jgi:hypothetical protein